MDRFDPKGPALALRISAMSETEICQFIRRESRNGQLSKAVKTLNRDALSNDTERRARAEAAIKKLGFL